jgi:glycosyltransferase involved in cell wall biosynthesis
MEYPLVTVFTLIYNTNPRYVISAIESVKANNYLNLQHIIIDDCSPDVSAKQEVKSWILLNNYPCEFYEHEINYGLNKTLNHVLSLAKGKYLVGCSDDILTPNSLKTGVEMLEQLPSNYAGVFSDVFLIDELNKPLPDQLTYLKRSYPKLTFPSSQIYYYENLLKAKANFIPPMSAFLKIRVLKELGGYDENLNFEDYDMFLRILKCYDFYYIDYILAKYRIHSESLSRSNKVMWEWNYFNIFFKHQQNSIAIVQMKRILKNVAQCRGSLKDYSAIILKINNSKTRLNLQAYVILLKFKYDFKNRVKQRIKSFLKRIYNK